MSTTAEVTITETAHTGCDACDASAEAARAYVGAGGQRTDGKFGNSQVAGGPHWATFTTTERTEAPALAIELTVSAAEEADHSLSEQISAGTGSDGPEPGSVQAAGGLDERFASLVSQVLGDLHSNTRRLEAEMAERDEVYVLAFEQVQAAVKQVAEVVRPLFDLPGFEVEDLKAVLNGTVQSVYFSWLETHPERRRLHDQ